MWVAQPKRRLPRAASNGTFHSANIQGGGLGEHLPHSPGLAPAALCGHMLVFVRIRRILRMFQDALPRKAICSYTFTPSHLRSWLQTAADLDDSENATVQVEV